jgi:hypothetical protein
MLVGRFEFVEWTPDGHLRHGRFVGLQDDRRAKDVRRSLEVHRSIPAFKEHLHKIAGSHCCTNIFSSHRHDKDLFTASA